MAATEADINLLLETLEALLKKIEPLRRRVDEIEKGQTEAQREYDQKLGQANAEADRLESLKVSMRAPTKGGEVPPPPPPSIGAIPPPPVFEVNVEPGKGPPPPPRESLRTKRKRTLLDYIFYITDEGPEIEKINALMDDDHHDMGDMLEMLAWGPIWKSRTPWETLDDQRQRLEEWRVVLEERFSYWTQECHRLEEDERYSLWKQKSELNENEWQAELDQMLQRQETDNQRLASEVAKLEEQSRAQQAGESEVTNG